jgi:4-aminobutyrate aminotransferase
MNREHENLHEEQQAFLFPSIYTYYKQPLVPIRGKGQYLYDQQGREYLDFFAGILTVSAGHCNEEVTNQVIDQVKQLQHTSTLYVLSSSVELARHLEKITPGDLQKSFFTNSGTEANETAILLARVHTETQDVIALRHSYHGRSILAMSLSGQAPWRLAPHAPAVIHAHNAYCYRCPFGLKYPSCDVRCAHDLEELIQTSTSGRVAAFIAEPIQGVAGFVVPPQEYFQITAGIVRKYGGLIISDEVQTGFGRTGKKMFGIEHWGVEPDIMTCAKAMANGFPIGATIARADVADSLKGLTISTFGGNPVSTTAAKAVIDFIQSENLLEHVDEIGAYLRDRLDELAEKHSLIGEVRGLGLMLALELVRDDRSDKDPAVEELTQLMELTKEKGLLIGKGGTYSNVARIAPPLIIGRGDVDDAIRILDESFAAIDLD